MVPARLLVVEDQSIIALDLQNRLAALGYVVAATAAHAEAAVQQARVQRPDLVLMDIRLKGERDGIEAAEQIRRELGLPVIFLTAHSDERTLERARLTEPYGYILKPFEDRELHMTIEIALYKSQMEARLKAHERWLAATLASIGEAVIATDQAGRIEFMNAAAEAATGWPQAAALNQELSQVFRLIDAVTGAPRPSPLAAEPGLAQPARLVARDGREMPIETSVAPIRDERGAPTGVVLVFRDVTARQQAEAALQASERRFRALIENSADGILVVDAAGRQVYASPATSRLLGYRPGEYLGRSLLELVHPDDVGEVLAQLEQLRQAPGGSAQRHFRAWHRAGHWRWLEVTATNLLDDPAVGGLVLNFADITERKRAEEQLRLLSRAVEQSPVSILITDTQRRIEYVNPHFTTVTGYERGEVLGQNPRLLSSGQTPAAEYQRLWTVLAAGGEWRGEFCNRKKSGELFWESATLSAIRNDRDEITHFVAVQEDVTERRAAAEALRASNLDLTRLLAQAKELAAAAQQANRLKDEILANTSHELRTPLTAILGALDIVLAGLYVSEDELRTFVRAARDAADRLLALVNDLLDLAKLEAGRMHSRLETVDVAALLADVQTLMRAQAEPKGLSLELEPPAGPLSPCLADAEHVRRILLNLLNNAVKFTSHGRILLTASQLASSADPGGPGRRVQIMVQDTGIGIPLEVQPQLFQPFAQVDGSSTRRYGGTGLGLSISRQLAELMGGSLTLDSAGEGQGSTFTLTLPTL